MLAIGEGAATVTFGDRDHAARRSPSDAEAGVTSTAGGDPDCPSRVPRLEAQGPRSPIRAAEHCNGRGRQEPLAWAWA